jgi:hypothetical protein
MVSGLYPGYRKPAMNGAAMGESSKLSHRWERKMEMEGLGPSGLGARLDGFVAIDRTRMIRRTFAEMACL